MCIRDSYYSRGFSELLKAGAVIGTGTGTRGLRFGGRFTLDVFPDLAGQPGLGLGGQVLYSNYQNGTRIEATVIPFLHKAFQMRDSGYEFSPYVAFPIGVASGPGDESNSLLQFSVGSLFRKVDWISFIVEIGISVHNSETYLSGGVVLYHR